MAISSLRFPQPAGMPTNDPTLFPEQEVELKKFYSQPEHSHAQLAPRSGEICKAGCHLHYTTEGGNEGIQDAGGNEDIQDGRYGSTDSLGYRGGRMHLLRPEEALQVWRVVQEAMEVWNDDTKTVVNIFIMQQKTMKIAAKAIGSSVGYAHRLLRIASDSLKGMLYEYTERQRTQHSVPAAPHPSRRGSPSTEPPTRATPSVAPAAPTLYTRSTL